MRTTAITQVPPRPDLRTLPPPPRAAVAEEAEPFPFRGGLGARLYEARPVPEARKSEPRVVVQAPLVATPIVSEEPTSVTETTPPPVREPTQSPWPFAVAGAFATALGVAAAAGSSLGLTAVGAAGLVIALAAVSGQSSAPVVVMNVHIDSRTGRVVTK